MRMSNLKDIRIREEGDEIVVDMYPGMFTTAYFEREPTKKDPNIEVDIGKIDGKLTPIRVHYPKSKFTLQDVLARKDKIMEKKKNCPLCERKKREVLDTFKSILASDDDSKTKERKFVEKVNELRKRHNVLKSGSGAPPPKPNGKQSSAGPVAPQPPQQLPGFGIQPQAPFMTIIPQGIPYPLMTVKSDAVIQREQTTQINVVGAFDAATELLEGLLTFPQRVFFGEEKK